MANTEDENNNSIVSVKKLPPGKGYFEEPGGLRNETRMEIQTRQAQKLITGRKRDKGVNPIIGLMDFGRRMKLLWLSAEADDPYADWHLLKVEESIKEARAMIKEKRFWLDEVLDAMEGIDIDIAQSLHPINISIYFQNPFGYMGAYLVKEYDSLACSVFTARHLGLIDRATSESIINVTGKAIRRTFTLVTLWKFTGVTREDMQQDNKNAQRAFETYGACPADVVSKKTRAKIAPAIRERQIRKDKTITLRKPGQDKEIKKDKESNESGAVGVDVDMAEIDKEKDKREAVAEALQNIASV
jgi:integrating conjugative element protein (TIGR03761 family)